MKYITDNEKQVWHRDEDTVQAISLRNFSWNKSERSFNYNQEAVESHDILLADNCNTINEIAYNTRIVLSNTSNSLSLNSNGISYRFIKAVKDKVLEDKLFEKIRKVLVTGKISHNWQDSKVIMISKPSKDHSQIKGWRHINLINCIEKLSEKVVVDHLQKGGLFYL